MLFSNCLICMHQYCAELFRAQTNKEKHWKQNKEKAMCLSRCRTPLNMWIKFNA